MCVIKTSVVFLVLGATSQCLRRGTLGPVADPWLELAFFLTLDFGEPEFLEPSAHVSLIAEQNVLFSVFWPQTQTLANGEFEFC